VVDDPALAAEVRSAAEEEEEEEEWFYGDLEAAGLVGLTRGMDVCFPDPSPPSSRHEGKHSL
jgi:hypothetical protein